MKRKNYPEPEDPKIKTLADEIRKLNLSFLIEQDKILNQHLPPDEEKTRINTLFQSLEKDIVLLCESSGKQVKTYHRKPKGQSGKYDFWFEYTPSIIILNFSDLQASAFHAVKKTSNLDKDIDEFRKYRCKNCGILERVVGDYCTITCREEARRKQTLERVRRLRSKHPRIPRTHLKTCEICGKQFQSMRSDARTCPIGPCRMKKYRLNRSNQN
ncbi:MAG: hypothetical protein ACLQBP_00925 [Methanoregula sp.]|uniref:hypothetical protein n=1 Tax=Methanoregula sp. TaxID=2052170 RepID=UPI003C675838